MSEATFTFRVDETLKNEFATAAKARDRTSAQLLRDFMREFVRRQQETTEHDAWFRGEVQKTLDKIDRGDGVFIEHDALFADLARRAGGKGRA